MRNASEIGLSIVGVDGLDEPVPGTVWWTGWVSCSLCGYGAPGHDLPAAISVMPISADQSEPFLMECPGCRNMTLSPSEDPR